MKFRKNFYFKERSNLVLVSADRNVIIHIQNYLYLSKDQSKQSVHGIGPFDEKTD